MEFEDLQFVTKCLECGCLFDYEIAIKDHKDNPKISVCPACKWEY